ncbi:hypothetical protein [Pandoraea pnomenusa]|uniref:hypothetical protein n=1 Tax=Pandoraea pnomenusa TaxID=93220 RepID=UPI003341A994
MLNAHVSTQRCDAGALRSPATTAQPTRSTSRTHPRLPLVDDFSSARQADMASGVAQRPDGMRSRTLSETHELSLVLRRTTNALAAGRNARRSPDHVDAEGAFGQVEQIYAMLRDEVAVPALRRFKRQHALHDKSAPHDSAHSRGSAYHPPWFDDLQPHLRTEAHVLAQRGLDAAKVRHRLEALLRHEHPGMSWHATRVGIERDALPFALGSTLLALLADTVDPKRSQALAWPPLEALGVVLVNLIGVARFHAAHPALGSRLGRITPAHAQEALARLLRSPVRQVTGHVIAFVASYGLLRNLARLAAEAGLNAWVPGIMSHRFGSTIHAGLEILLAPLPGALLGPAIDRLGMPREYAALEIAIQDRFADLIADAGATATPPFWPTFWRAFSGLMRSGASAAIWSTLTLGFYFLSTLPGAATSTRDEDVAALAANATTTASDLGPPDAAGTDIDWHGLSILSLLYGIIASAVALQNMATRNHDIATAYTRRRGRPKISTITLSSQADSGRASTLSNLSNAEGIDSPMSDMSDGQTDGGDTPGDVSGDDSVFLPMHDTETSPDATPSLPSSPRATLTRKWQVRRHGTAVAPDTLAMPDEDAPAMTRL